MRFKTPRYKHFPKLQIYSIIFKLQILFLISFTQTSLKYYLTRNSPQDLDLKDDKERGKENTERDGGFPNSHSKVNLSYVSVKNTLSLFLSLSLVNWFKLSN